MNKQNFFIFVKKIGKMKFLIPIIIFSFITNNIISITHTLYKKITLQKKITNLTLSKNNKLLAVLLESRHIQIFSLENFSFIKQLTNLEYPEVVICFSPDNNYILTGNYDRSLKLWDIRSEKVVNRYYGHELMTRSIDFHPSGNIIVSGGWDNTLRFWHTPTALNIMNVEITNQCIRAVAFSNDGNYVACTGYDQYLRVFDLKKNEEKFNVLASNYPLEVLAYSPDNNFIVTTGIEKIISLWDANNGKLIKKSKPFKKQIRHLSFSPDGKYLIVCGDEQEIKILEIPSLKIIYKFIAHNNKVINAFFTLDGKFLISCGEDNEIKIWTLSQLNINPINDTLLNKEIKDILFNFPTIKIISPNNLNYISPKRINQFIFQNDNKKFQKYQLFLNKREYTRFYNNEKVPAKPISKKTINDSITELTYEIYLDYDISFIQLIAIDPTTYEIITSPEIKVSYFDIEAHKDRVNFYLLYLNPTNFSNQNLKNSFINDNSGILIPLFKNLKNTLYYDVSIININNLDNNSLKLLIDSLDKIIKTYDVIFFYLNTFFLKKDGEIYLLTEQSNYNNLLEKAINLKEILKFINQKKGTNIILANLSQNIDNLPKDLSLISLNDFSEFFVDNLTIEKKIYFCAFSTSNIQNVGNIILKALSHENDHDNNKLIDYEEFTKYIKNKLQINVLDKKQYIILNSY